MSDKSGKKKVGKSIKEKRAIKKQKKDGSEGAVIPTR